MDSLVSQKNANSSPIRKNEAMTSSSSSSNDAGDVSLVSTTKEGYLQKKGQLLKGWKKRWFVCDGKNLSYYITHKDKKPNAVIPLATCTVQDGGISETWNSPRIYLTDGTDGTIYCLSAEEGHVVTEWLTVLRSAKKRLGNTNTSDRTSLVHSSFDEEEGRLKRAPSMGHSHAQRSPKKGSNKFHGNAHKGLKQMPTSIKLENELTKAFQTIEAFAMTKTSFRIQTVRNGVRISTYETPEGSTFVKGSVVVNAPPDAVAQLVADTSKRGEWDTHFPCGSTVASYGATTELVHLSGWRKLQLAVHFAEMPPSAAIAMGVLIAALSTYVTGAEVLLSSICGAAVGALLTSLDFRALCYARDLLLVKHIREHPDGSYTVMERSVVNELKPVVTGIVRATTTATGFIVQPIDTGNNLEVQSLVTMITDVNVGGWVPRETKCEFLMQRTECLSNIREFVVQSNVYGEEKEEEERDGLAMDVEEESEVGSLSLSSSAVASASSFAPTAWRTGFARSPTGGLKLTDKEIAKKQKGVLMEVLKSFGAAILEGKSAVSLSLPVRIFEPRSMLERIVDLWLYAPIFLKKAGDTSDPLERLKLVIAFAFAGLHHCVGQQKPFNPILGETYQTELGDGTKVYCEHTSHHPPISNFQLLGSNFTMWGHFVFSGSFKTNAITQTQAGPVHVDFTDGTRVTYNMPYLRNGGFLWGDRITEILGLMEFVDKKNNLRCELRFNPDEKKGMGGMFAAVKTPSDHCRGVVMRTDTQQEVCDVSGSWLDEIKFSDAVYWDINKDVCSHTVSIPNVLKSDCRHREDLESLKKEELDEAQEWKIKLEKLQRADRAERKAGYRPNHWMNSKHEKD